MAAKVTYAYRVNKGNKKATLEFLGELQALPQHSWIPFSEMSESAQATLTPRQAGWLENRIARQIDGAVIEFTAVAVEADES